MTQMVSSQSCWFPLHSELLHSGVVVFHAVSCRQQPAVAQHGSSTRVTRPSHVKADLPGPLPLPRDLTPHDARAPVRPHTALWKKQTNKKTRMKIEKNCARKVCARDNVRQLSSSEPSSQSGSPSQSGFSLLMHLPLLQRKVNSEHRCSTSAGDRTVSELATADVTLHPSFSGSADALSVFVPPCFYFPDLGTDDQLCGSFSLIPAAIRYCRLWSGLYK